MLWCCVVVLCYVLSVVSELVLLDDDDCGGGVLRYGRKGRGEKVVLVVSSSYCYTAIIHFHSTPHLHFINRNCLFKSSYPICRVQDRVTCLHTVT